MDMDVFIWSIGAIILVVAATAVVSLKYFGFF